MSEHSTEELKRQWIAASDRAKQAAFLASEAKSRYLLNVLTSSGLDGHVAEGVNWRKKPERFVVTGVKLGWRDEVIAVGKLLKKDGTVGHREVSHAISGLSDLGEYVETKE